MNIKEILSDKNKTNEFIMNNKNLVVKAIQKTYPSVLNTYEEEDYIQEGLVSLYKAMLNYDESKGIKFSAFAFIVVKRNLIKRIKCEKNKLNQTKNYVSSLNIGRDDNMDDTEKIDFIESETNIEEEVVQKDNEKILFKNVHRLMESLKPEYQDILKYLLDNKSQTDIASIMGCSRQNISQKVESIRKIAKELKVVYN